MMNALNNSSQCFCGNSTYGLYGRAKYCLQPCLGNVSQVCGDTSANSIYLASLSNN